MTALFIIFVSMLLAWNVVPQPDWCKEFWNWCSNVWSKNKSKEETKEETKEEPVVEKT